LKIWNEPSDPNDPGDQNGPQVLVSGLFASDCFRTSGSLLRSLVNPPVERGNFLHPAPPFSVLQVEDRIRRPMEVIGHEGYLLVQLLEGVA